MTKKLRVEDPFAVVTEDERVVEFWFHATVPPSFRDHYDPSSLLFTSVVMGMEEKSLLYDLTESDVLPEQLSVRFLRKKVNVMTSLQQMINDSPKMVLYVRALGLLDQLAQGSARQGGRSLKKDRRRKSEVLVTDSAEVAASFDFDMMELLLKDSVRFRIADNEKPLFEDCILEVRSTAPLVSPKGLSEFRPLKLEICSIANIPAHCRGRPVEVTVNFGNINVTSPKIELPHDGRIAFRHLAFLDRDTFLGIYQMTFNELLTVTLSDYKGILVGKGTLSLREFATDQRVRFNEMVHLLPVRASGCTGDCLAEGTFVTIKLDFFSPLPQHIHVRSDGQPVHGQFLTCGVVRMPYMTSWTDAVLSTFIATLLEFKKPSAKSDVYQRKIPVVVPVVDVPKEKKKEPKSNKGQAAVVRQVPTPPPPFSGSFEIVTPPGISGIEMMDGDVRIICLEGPVAEMHKLFERISAASGHDPRLVLLMNAELFIPKRRYISFPPLVTVPSSYKETEQLLPAVEDLLLENGSTSQIQVASSSHTESTVGSLQQGDATVCQEAENCTSGDDVTTVENIEDDGTGGRIHRVRIAETITSLMSHHRHLLKRSLSEACVSCYVKLHAICGCSQLRDVISRDLFPTPEEVLALERSFGRILELSDVFGREEFVDVTRGVDTDMFQKQETTREATPVVDLLNLQEVDVGKTVVFEAKRGSCSREIPALIKQRFPFACWIRLLGVGKDFLCAFSNSQPSRSIRYRIEAQVIRWSGWLVLFALGSTILAKTLTESYNPAYEAHLSALRRAKRDKVLKAKQTPRLTVNDSVAEAFPLHVDDDCDSEEYLETLRYEDDIRSRRRGSTVIDALPRGQRRPVHVRPTRYELQQQYAICWEIYNRRAPPERPQRPKVLPMRF